MDTRGLPTAACKGRLPAAPVSVPCPSTLSAAAAASSPAAAASAAAAAHCATISMLLIGLPATAAAAAEAAKPAFSIGSAVPTPPPTLSSCRAPRACALGARLLNPGSSRYAPAAAPVPPPPLLPAQAEKEEPPCEPTGGPPPLPRGLQALGSSIRSISVGEPRAVSGPRWAPLGVGAHAPPLPAAPGPCKAALPTCTCSPELAPASAPAASGLGPFCGDKKGFLHYGRQRAGPQ